MGSNRVVGDFTFVAELFFRQQMKVEVFYQDTNNVQQNMVTFRCEERVALAVL